MSDLLNQPLRVVNLGLRAFGEELAKEGVPVAHVDWRPPAGGDAASLQALLALQAHSDAIATANRTAIDRLRAAHPTLTTVASAGDVIPELDALTLLHAGPPVTWERMCGPQRGAVIGALLYEGLAATPDEAEELAASEKIRFRPCHSVGAVGPMAGIISRSMPVFVVKNTAHGNRAFAPLNEGLGKVLRFGAYQGEVITRLRWLRDELAPALAAALQQSGPIDLRLLTARALHMGDECHNRNVAATSLFVRSLMPDLAATSASENVCRFLAGNDHFFLNLSMAACKSALDAAHGIQGSTLVTAMARNGTEFGIRISGLGDRWFTAPSPRVEGLYFPGFGPQDANPDLGDSAITETFGIGGFAMAAAPAIVQFVGGTPADAIRYTREMAAIAMAESPHYTLPSLQFAPAHLGIDLLKVVRSGVSPVINTGIAHRSPGVGQIGAGVVRAPFACFRGALTALAVTIS